MSEVKRTIRIKTEQHVLKDVPPVENFPMRQWSIEVAMLDQSGKEVPANILDKVTYTLHPTFANPIRTIKSSPFRVEEQGWGEFDIPISIHILGLTGKTGERKFNHDLNFAQEVYTNDHVVTIPVGANKNPQLNKLLLETGTLPFEETNQGKRKLETSSNGPSVTASSSDLNNKVKKSKSSNGSAVKGNIDLEKLANGLTKLSEDDLIVIVQMVTDNRTSEMNIKNDVDNAEFTMDLYTLPESLLKSLWDYVKKHNGDV